MLKDRSKRWAIVGVVLVVLSVALWSEFEGTGAFRLNPIGHADLQISELNIDQTAITAMIYNDGTDAQRGFTVDFYEREAGTEAEWTNEDFIGEEFVQAGLREGRTVEVIHEWEPTAANNREIKVIIDSNDVILERNDGEDNEETGTFTPTSVTPDLSVSGVSLVDQKIVVDIANSGSAKDTAFVVYFQEYSSGIWSKFHTETIEGIGAATSETLMVLYTPADNVDKIRLIVDAERNIAESNEDNNILIVDKW